MLTQTVIPTRYDRLAVPWPVRASRNILRYVGRAAIIIIYSRIYSATAAAVLSAWIGAPLIWWPWFVLGIMIIAFGYWLVRQPEEISQSLRGWRRSCREYRLTWGRAMRRSGIANWYVPTPILLHTWSTGYVDKLRVRIPLGLTPQHFEGDYAETLRWGWRAQSTRLYDPQPKRRTVELWNLITDPLVDPVAPFLPTVEPLPKHIDAALQEDGLPWQAKIRGGAASVFVCGISGSGKGSVVGAYLDGLHEGIQASTVEAWGIDPQASELGMWRHLFAKLVYTQTDAADMLEELCSIMDRRTRRMFGVARQHHPAPGDPFYLMVIDEGLDLLDKTDRKTFRRLDTALGRLLRQGRKASIMVMFLSQRAELAIVERRKEFPISVALEHKTDIDVDMVLGKGALAAGARAHEIIEPGIAYVATDKGIVRVRFPHITDDHITDLDPAPGNEDPANLPPAPGDDELVDMGFA